MSVAAGTLKFRHTCRRHQQMFVEAVERAGCSEPAEMDDVTRRLLAWFSAHYPRLTFDHIRQGNCLGCEIEARFGSLSEVGRAIRELLNEPKSAHGRAAVTGRTPDPG